MIPYHHPASVYIRQEDSEVPTFNFDPSINPITAYKIDKIKTAFTEVYELEEEELDEIDFGDDFAALLEEENLWDKDTSNGIALLWAPRPFN